MTLKIIIPTGDFFFLTDLFYFIFFRVQESVFWCLRHVQPLLRDIKQMEITFPLHFLTFVMRSLVLKIHLQTNNSGHSFRHTLGDSFNFLQG